MSSKTGEDQTLDPLQSREQLVRGGGTAPGGRDREQHPLRDQIPERAPRRRGRTGSSTIGWRRGARLPCPDDRGSSVLVNAVGLAYFDVGGAPLASAASRRSPFPSPPSSGAHTTSRSSNLAERAERNPRGTARVADSTGAASGESDDRQSQSVDRSRSDKRVRHACRLLPGRQFEPDF